MNIRIKRIYDSADESDGMRVLVDRLWPRGIRKTDAKIDLWLKEIAPSNDLRTWFGHKPERWDKFHEQYTRELEQNTAAMSRLLELTGLGNVTLVYAARDRKCNHARVISDYVGQQQS